MGAGLPGVAEEFHRAEREGDRLFQAKNRVGMAWKGHSGEGVRLRGHRIPSAWCFRETMGVQHGESKCQWSRSQIVWECVTSCMSVRCCRDSSVGAISSYLEALIAFTQVNIFLLVKSVIREKGMVHI